MKSLICYCHSNWNSICYTATQLCFLMKTTGILQQMHMFSYGTLFRNKMFPNYKKLDENFKILTGNFNGILTIVFPHRFLAWEICWKYQIYHSWITFHVQVFTTKEYNSYFSCYFISKTNEILFDYIWFFMYISILICMQCIHLQNLIALLCKVVVKIYKKNMTMKCDFYNRTYLALLWYCTK